MVRLCSGLSKDATQPCINWMTPFVEAARCSGRATLREFSSVKTDDKHNFQTHADYMSMLVSFYLLDCFKAFEPFLVFLRMLLCCFDFSPLDFRSTPAGGEQPVSDSSQQHREGRTELQATAERACTKRKQGSDPLWAGTGGRLFTRALWPGELSTLHRLWPGCHDVTKAFCS